jgi:hypothetical protein
VPLLNWIKSLSTMWGVSGRRVALTILFTQLLHPCILCICESEELNFGHVRCRGLLPEMGVVVRPGHCEGRWMGGMRGGWRKAGSNWIIYTCPVTRCDKAAGFNRVNMEWMPKFDIPSSLLFYVAWPVHLSPALQNGGVSVAAKQPVSRR